MEKSKTTSKCFICEQEFSQQNLEAHFLECDQEHKCEKCDKIFQTANLLNNHVAVHDEQGHKAVHKIHESCTFSFFLSAGQPESFDSYPHADILNEIGGRKAWHHDYGRPNEEKVIIQKLHNNYGFKYTLEAPTSSSVR